MYTRILSILLLACLCAHSEGSRRHATKGIVQLCCTQVSSTNISAAITGRTYEIQVAKGDCVHSIILRKNSEKVCVDPKAQWVKELIANMKAGKL